MKKFASILIFCIIGVFCCFSAFGQAAGGQLTTGTPTPSDRPVVIGDSQNEKYLIGLQDVLEISVFHHTDLNQRVSVNSAGMISLFRLEAPIVAACKTESQLADDITKAYNKNYLRNAQVTVRVAEQKSQVFAVIGAVEKPGNYFISRKVQLLELLAYAGGPSKEAGTRILVARTGRTSTCKQAPVLPENDNIAIMDFKIRDVQEMKQKMEMEPGDIVSVLEADLVYMYGSVNKPGPLKLREPITLRQAIASAEGIKNTASTDKIRILRRVAGKIEPEELIFNLGQIDKGKVKDPFLEPNDIVAISQDSMKVIYHGIVSTVKTAVPSAIYAIP